jgi:hypothetical protein
MPERRMSNATPPSEYKDIAAQFAAAKAQKAQEIAAQEQKAAVQSRPSVSAQKYAEARFTVTQGLLIGFLVLLL